VTEYLLLQEAFFLLFGYIIGVLLAVFLAAAITTSMILIVRGNPKAVDVHIVGNDE